MNSEQSFWAGRFGEEYRKRNQGYEGNLEKVAWSRMLKNANSMALRSILECGSNTGRNLVSLKALYPQAEMSLIELNRTSFDTAVGAVKPVHSFCGSIVDSQLPAASFDLVFTSGVLIHIAPQDIYRNLEKMFSYSTRYVLIAEYFARELEMIPYHGERNKLFRMDYGRFFLNNFAVQVVDYGFLWGEEFDRGGFDDVTWWLFEKKPKV